MDTRLDIHRAADEVERWITGTRGIAATRIVYVRDDRVYLIDSDGSNDHALTTHGVALSPSWHPRGTSIVYSDLTDAGTQIARLDLATGAIHVMSATRRGLNITPVFTPRGDSVVYATAGPRGARLVIASATKAGRARLFRRGTIASMNDVAAPTFSPDGRYIAFVASHPTYPQVYTMHANGTNVRLLVQPTPGLRNERTAPDWSPDGSAIAFQQQNHQFQIWVAQLHDGAASLVTRFTSEAENEDPSWAPDGQHLVLTSSRSGTKELWVLDTVSGRWRQLTHAPGARLSAWSPRLRATSTGASNKSPRTTLHR